MPGSRPSPPRPTASSPRLDLSQRQKGDILGAAQHGRRTQRFLHILEDEDVIEQPREHAFASSPTTPTYVSSRPRSSGARQVDAEQAAYLERG